MSARAQAVNAAIECNNVGVSLLGMGLIVESLNAFQLAAQILYTTPTSPVEAAIQQMPPLPGSLQEEDDNTMVQQVKATLFLAKESAVMKKHLAADDSFMCVDPLTLASLEGEPTSWAMESATVVMNMGLAYYLYGSEAYLIKALSLFDMAFSISHPLIDELRSENVATVSLNNAAKIQHSLGNYLSSTYYLSILQAYIRSLPETSNHMKLKARRRFMLNSMLLQEPTTAIAA